MKWFFTILISLSFNVIYGQVALSYQSGSSNLVPDQWLEFDKNADINWKESYWLKVDLEVEKPGSYVLQGGNWYMANMEFFDSINRQIGDGNSISLELEKGSHTFYIYYPFIDQKSDVAFNVIFESETQYLRKAHKKNVYQVAFLSIIGFLILISIIMVLRSNDRVYTYYGIYLFTIFYFFAYQYGLLDDMLPFVRHIPPALVWISSASLSVAYIFFAISFLSLKETDIIGYKVLMAGAYYILLVVTVESVSYLFDYDIQHEFFYKLAVIGIQFPLMVVYLYRVYLMKNVLSYIFLSGALVLMFTTLTGQYSSTFYQALETNLVVQGGLLLDIFIFSFGIAVRVGLIYKGREDAQNQLIDQLQLNEKLQKEYTESLEKKVRERTSELEKKNVENEILLKEIHHRVKNNLQMISSLLNIQARRLADQKGKEILNITKNRIRSIGLIHEHLYSHDHLSKIEMKSYVEDLAAMLKKTMYTGESELQMVVEVSEQDIDFDTAITIGLILNELITNSLKYAFKDHSHPFLLIKLEEVDDALEISVNDNGPGTNEAPSGFGWSIINATLEGSNGTVAYENSGGFRVKIRINNYILV